tara:strand:- start:161 stop:793 length:633 start_codon:yes stop_codon:yes gene_type:complete
MNKEPTKPRGPGRPKTPIEKTTLLALARQLFAQKGYAGTSMMSIADAAGISKASVFHHYPSKEALYLAALNTILEEMGTFIEQAKTTYHQGVEGLDKLTDAVIDYFATHPQAAKLLLYELLSQGPFMSSGGDAVVKTVMAQAVSFIELIGKQDQATAVESAMSIFGIHLLYFGASDVTAEFKGTDIFSAREIEKRKIAVRQQVRNIALNS